MAEDAHRATVLSPDCFESAPMVTEAGHSCSFSTTWSRLSEILPRVPVTRIHDATPLDVVGLPTWFAVTPLAKDLTVHAGKGASAEAARLSAAMEALERVCAESITADRLRTYAYDELDPTQAVDPRSLDLAFESSYRPDLPIAWTGAYDLVSRRHVWVPSDAVISPAIEGICIGTETNGLASGNTYTEATLHALFEVVERDAAAREDFYHVHHDELYSTARPLQLIHAATLPEPSRTWVAKLVGEGLRVQVQDLTAPTGVPVYRVVIVEESYLGEEGSVVSFAGHGADLDPARALFRAVAEAVQSHTGVTLGARDEFEGMRPLPDRPAMLQRHARFLYGDSLLPFVQASESTGDVLLDLELVLRRLQQAGYSQCLVTELTRADLGVPVVRVMVPGLAAPYGDSTRSPTPALLSEVV